MKLSLLAGGTVCLLAAGLTNAVEAQSRRMENASSGRYAPVTARGQAAGAIVKRWSPYVQSIYGTAPRAWAHSMAMTFAEADLTNLRAAARSRSYESMMSTLLGQSTPEQEVGQKLLQASSLDAVKALGSPSVDLVYTMVAPCRIMDTRVAVGRLSSGVARDIAVHAASFAGQGGAASDCTIPADPSAVALNIVAVTPDNSGFLTVYPSGTTRPNASSLNYTTGAIVANGVIAKTTTGQPSDLAIYSQAGTDVVVDIVGYFMAPQATALSCIDTAETIVNVAAGATANATAPACSIGYTAVDTQCESSTWQMPFVYFSGGTCSAQNNSVSSASLRASRRCCRVPGR